MLYYTIIYIFSQIYVKFVINPQVYFAYFKCLKIRRLLNKNTCYGYNYCSFSG